MLRHHFYAKERTAVPARSATNSRPLRPSDPLYDPEKADFVRKKLASSISCGILKRRRTPCLVASSISLVDRPPGSTDRWRIVDNMAHLKENYDKKSFQAETVADLPNILAADMFMLKLDLTVGYFNMLVRRCMRRLFGSTFEGVHTEAVAAPFAFRHSARWMHKLTRTLCAHYRLQGIAVITFLDDKLYAKPGFVPSVRTNQVRGRRLDVHDPTTFASLNSLPSARPFAIDRPSRLAAAANTFAAEVIGADPCTKKCQLCERAGVPPLQPLSSITSPSDKCPKQPTTRPQASARAAHRSPPTSKSLAHTEAPAMDRRHTKRVHRQPRRR